MNPLGSAERKAPGWLRAAAFAGMVALPVAWLLSLSSQPEHLAANLSRVAGAIAMAGATWAVYARRGGTPRWQPLLAAGLVGSVATTVLSVLLPMLGSYLASGWFVSGVVGGGVVALLVYGVNGPAAGLGGESRGT